MSSDNAKPRATALPQLEWQGELDTAMADIDTRLTHPRRRSSDGDRQPLLPELGEVRVTTEMLDEIAWRVAEQIRRSGQPVSPEALAEALTRPAESARTERRPPGHNSDEPGLAPGKMLSIRFKLPALPWPLRLLRRRGRKKQHPLTTAKVRA